MTGVKWGGTAALLIGTALLALALPAAGFPVRIVGDALWIVVALRMREGSIVALTGTFLVIDCYGALSNWGLYAASFSSALENTALTTVQAIQKMDGWTVGTAYRLLDKRGAPAGRR